MPFTFDNSYARLPDAFFALTNPTPVNAPELIALNRHLAADLGIQLTQLDSAEGLSIVAGNQLPEGSKPLAMAYAGHQFGGFSPQLGDGRALLLGEVIGKNGSRYDIQLKGSGQTPFSRRGDGRSALGPVLREYIVSEAMAALGVPTTRALAAVWSGDQVLREGYEPGGIFTRVARSHIRVGTFQYFAARQDQESVRILADYVIDRLYPAARKTDNPHLALLECVIQGQAELVAQWMQLGFIHGVMNTDNMAVSAETIDYGPCAFMDHYDPTKKFSYIDQQGRYAYHNQPAMAHWNLTRLAETLLPLLADCDDNAFANAKTALDRFSEIYQRELVNGFTSKIGIENADENDWKLVQSLLTIMTSDGADFTLTFRHLRNAAENCEQSQLLALFKTPEAISGWLKAWLTRLKKEKDGPEKATHLMRKINPVFIPRNHRIEELIQAALKHNFEPFHQLHQVLQHPFAEQTEFVDYEAPPTPGQEVQATFCGT